MEELRSFITCFVFHEHNHLDTYLLIATFVFYGLALVAFAVGNFMKRRYPNVHEILSIASVILVWTGFFALFVISAITLLSYCF